MKTSNEPRAMAGLSLTMLMPSLDTSIANAALPAFSHAFAASFQAVQWIVLAYLLSVTILIVVAGRLGDLLGRRRLLLGGISLFVLASALCALAPGLGFLLAARAVQGAAAAIMLALAMACVGDAVAKENTGRAMGLLGSMSAIGTTLGPALGGLLLASCGWRAIFLVNLPLGLLALLLVARHLPAAPGPASHPAGQPRPSWHLRFDLAGMLWLALTLAAYALAMTSGRGQLGLQNGLLLLLAALGAVLLVRNEARAPAPLIDLALFRQHRLRAGLVMTALVATVMMSTLVVGPFYLAQGLGLGAAQLGLALAPGPLVAALAGMPAGRLVQRFGAARMSIAGLGGMALATLALSAVPCNRGLAGYMLAIVILTASYAQFQAANNTALMSNIKPDQRGVLAALLGLSRNLGLITGAAVMGALFAIATARAAPGQTLAAATTGGMHVTFALASGLILLALGIALRSGHIQASKSAAAMVPVITSGRNT